MPPTAGRWLLPQQFECRTLLLRGSTSVFKLCLVSGLYCWKIQKRSATCTRVRSSAANQSRDLQALFARARRQARVLSGGVIRVAALLVTIYTVAACRRVLHVACGSKTRAWIVQRSPKQRCMPYLQITEMASGPRLLRDCSGRIATPPFQSNIISARHGSI